MPLKRLNRDDYEVAWICPLEVEQIAAMEMLDEEHETLPQPRGDTNIYNLGAINNHNVVIAGFPKAGNCPAAAVITQMKMTFPNLKHGLLVGIGGGVPVKTDQGMIRLGHVVVSEPTGVHSGAVQYDHGKATAGQFELKGSLNPPPTALLNAAREVSVRRQRLDHDPIWKNTQRIDTSRPHLRRFKFPGVANDCLYQPHYEHRRADASCEDGGCDPKQRIERPINEFHETFVTVHRGTVASGELVIKDAMKRDNLARKLGVLCFEMEAAGASTDFPCMVIRGISDYCDSHKNDMWHGYAAAVAAAYARQLFFHMSIKEAAKSFDPTPHSFELSFDLTEISAVPYFVARQDELRQMHKLLRGLAGRLTVILYGLGGMGKTQLAMAYMKRHFSEYHVAIWLNARDEMALKQSFARAAEKIQRLDPSLSYLSAALESRDLDEIWTAVKRWLEEPMNNRWIVTYDNYDDPRLESGVIIGRPSHKNRTDPKPKFQGHDDGFDSKAFDIRPYFPTANHGSIIVTTRSSAVNFGPSMKIGKLRDANDSLEILAQTSRRNNFKEDPAAIKLAQCLDGLPLAIATAGAYLHQVTISCAEYLQMYHDSWLQLHEETPQLLSYDQRLYSTWGISYSRIKQQSQVAAMVLRQWAYFSNEDLWYELLKEGRPHGPGWLCELTDSKLRFHGIMRILCDHGLVEAGSTTQEPESAGYSVHAISPNSNEMHRIPRHADRLLEYTINMEVADGTAWAFHRLGTLYSDQGRLREAETTYKRALDGCDAWDPKHTLTLRTINNLGILYTYQDRLREAEAMYKRALDVYEKALGPNHTLALRTVNNLGTLYVDQGRLQEAETMYKRALDGKEKAWGPHHISTLGTVNNLGVLYRAQGRLQEAETTYKRALDGYEKAWGPNHTSMLDTVNNLGSLYSDQGRLQEAEVMYKRALDGYEKAWGPNHTLALRTVNNLGVLYRVQGRLQEAEAICERALDGYEKARGPNHTSTLRAVNNLGALYRVQGRLQEAGAMYKRALEGYEKTLGPISVTTHNPTLDTLENFGDLYVELGQVADAIWYYQRAQNGVEAAFGRESQKYVRLSQAIASVRSLGRQGRLQRAWNKITNRHP
ncbi:Nephrocystin-3 [Beauveria bassiana D1-5]|uniref:Nephrocystin-3 n=1 Tax=Beauveria bassiana D1-5 TaxID=1245745 RepID=A0A0A2VHX7_BEABA|nr:Nephrocystin-3 [Beauveria bassiana D1-5]